MGEDCPDERLEDLRLAHAAAAGDAAARRLLAGRLLRRVRNVARYLTSSSADAEDAAQTAMLEILRAAGSYRGEGTLARWATRITVRTTLALAHRRRREAPTDRDAPPQPATAARIDGPLLRQRLLRCFERLPDERREAVVLRLVVGCTLEEIADQTGVPLNTAKDRLRVGRQELRDALRTDPVLLDAVGKGLP